MTSKVTQHPVCMMVDGAKPPCLHGGYGSGQSYFGQPGGYGSEESYFGHPGGYGSGQSYFGQPGGYGSAQGYFGQPQLGSGFHAGIGGAFGGFGAAGFFREGGDEIDIENYQIQPTAAVQMLE